MCRKIKNPALEYGKQHEGFARGKYEELLGVQIKPTGLTLMSSHPYIAASADGMVGSTVIEIKCPYTGQDKTIDELVAGGYNHIAKVNGEWEVNKLSHYYCQIQGEIAIKQCSLCHFVVWTMKDIVIIPVKFDKLFWDNELFPKLVSYFNEIIKPKLAKTD
jgi:YqaJ-like viral recombinase domain